MVAADYIKRPCGLYFLGYWTREQKAGVLAACRTINATTIAKTTFRSPTLLFLTKGLGDAHTNKYSITFNMSDIRNSEAFDSTALHELSHLIDMRNGLISNQSTWLKTAGWTCTSSDVWKCTHPCQQNSEKAFYCNYKDFEVLPSRYNTPEYDPRQADVSINPMEDFAESSRYFFQANDELSKTSVNRCMFLKNLYFEGQENNCYDCNSLTKCQNSF